MLGLLLARAPPADAAVTNAVFTIFASVQASCLVSLGDLVFGRDRAAPADGVATINVTCSDRTPWYVTIGDGADDSDGYPASIEPGGQRREYRFFQDRERTQAWRNSSNANGQAGAGNGSAQQLTFYGRVYAGTQDSTGPGRDAGIVTVTVAY